MKKRLVPIYSVLVVAIVLLAVFAPSCVPAEKGTIEVKATLCDAPWSGDVSYTLIGPGATAPTVIDGIYVPDSFSVTPGDWICGNVSGGPAGAYLESITPSANQTVSADGTITFTLNFELEQDAVIDFLYWTVNGEPVTDYEEEYGGYYYAEVTWCDNIDVHYIQRVDGCEGRQVTLIETDELLIHYYTFQGSGDPDPVSVWVYDDWCAVNKTATPEGPPSEKLSQVPSYEGEPVKEGEGYMEYFIPYGVNTTLDVQTSWQLEKCVNYTKSINWLHIYECGAPPPEGDSPCCILFDLMALGPGYGFELWSRASIELAGDEDINLDNNSTGWSPPLILMIVPISP